MPQRGPLHWVDGQGWLVLLGGGSLQRGETDVVDSHVLSVANLDRPMAVLWGGGSQDEATEVLEHYVALGGPGGEALVLDGTPCHAADFLSLLAEAGILYLGGENPLLLTRSLQDTPVLKQIVKGFVTLQGLLIVGAGGGAMALGAWVSDLASPAQTSPGLNFLQSVIVAPHFTRSEEAGALRALLQDHPRFVGLGIPDGTALALGPRGQVETWGKGEVTAVVRADG